MGPSHSCRPRRRSRPPPRSGCPLRSLTTKSWLPLPPTLSPSSTSTVHTQRQYHAPFPVAASQSPFAVPTPREILPEPLHLAFPMAAPRLCYMESSSPSHSKKSRGCHGKG